MMIWTFSKSQHLRADDDDEFDKIPNNYLRFCPMGFIPHIKITFIRTIFNGLDVTDVIAPWAIPSSLYYSDKT